MFVPLTLAACTKDHPAEAPQPVAAPAVEKATPAEGEAYAVSLSAPAGLHAGESANAAVTITAKQGFHVNPDYPVAFKPEGSEGVAFTAERVRLENGRKTPCEGKAEDSCRVEFDLPLTPEQAGVAKAAGVLAFSVCSEDKCLIEKVPLTVALNAQ